MAEYKKLAKYVSKLLYHVQYERLRFYHGWVDTPAQVENLHPYIGFTFQTVSYWLQATTRLRLNVVLSAERESLHANLPDEVFFNGDLGKVHPYPADDHFPLSYHQAALGWDEADVNCLHRVRQPFNRYEWVPSVEHPTESTLRRAFNFAHQQEWLVKTRGKTADYYSTDIWNSLQELQATTAAYQDRKAKLKRQNIRLRRTPTGYNITTMNHAKMLDVLGRGI